MPEANHYTVTNREIVELIIKSVGLNEGKWSLTINFAMAPGAFGPNPAQVFPGVAIMIQGLGIQREPSDTKSPPELFVDAAKLK